MKAEYTTGAFVELCCAAEHWFLCGFERAKAHQAPAFAGLILMLPQLLQLAFSSQALAGPRNYIVWGMKQ